MPVIALSRFSGEQPRLVPRLLPPSGAQSAVNVRLTDGALTPVRAMTNVGSVAGAGYGTIYKHGATWLGWASGSVRIAEGPVAQDRIYYTGDGAPKMRIASGTVYPLAVPRPADAPTATIVGTATGADKVSRVYVYTFVTEFGEESEPSPPSPAVTWIAGQTVTVSGISAAPSGRAITKQRFYRTQTGRSGTYLYFIAERDESDLDFDDDIAADDFQETLPSANWNAPVDSLAGLVSLPNGMMAAFSGKDIYFCEPWRPHAWPEQYVLTTDSAIVALGAIGNTLVVMTEAQPYIVMGSHPSSMQMVKTEINLPCINARGVADLGFAIVYPSHEGLVAVRADGGASIASGEIFTRDEWLKYSPATMIGSQISGVYVGFYSATNEIGEMSAGAILLDVSGQGASLTRQDTIATAAWFDAKTGGTYVQLQNSTAITRLDSPTAPRLTLSWTSKPFIHNEPMNYGAIFVEAEVSLSGVERRRYEVLSDAAIARNAARIATGKIYGDLHSRGLNRQRLAGDILERPQRSGFFGQDGFGRAETVIIADGRVVTTIDSTNRVVRLPAGFKARQWEIGISSNVRIEKISLATTITDLQQSPPG
jgi:hypothetical protein